MYRQRHAGRLHPELCSRQRCLTSTTALSEAEVAEPGFTGGPHGGGMGAAVVVAVAVVTSLSNYPQ